MADAGFFRVPWALHVTGQATLLPGQEGGQETNLEVALPLLHLMHSAPRSLLTPGGQPKEAASGSMDGGVE